MTTYTRKTHVVRITGATPDIWVDIEVLDAVAFRNVRGEEMILSLDAAKASPYILDATGDGNAKAPALPTRRSHMERITSTSDTSKFFDIEVIEAVAFRDKRGEEWILNMPGQSTAINSYNSTTGQGSQKSTRRVHNEKIYSDPKDTTSDYVTVQRCDNMAFRNVRGEEMVITMPSSDDKSGPGRASTYMTPQGYDPTSTAVVPPNNTDPAIYAFFPPGSAGPYTGDVPIAQGPLWWIRGISPKGGPWYAWIPTWQPEEWTLTYHHATYPSDSWSWDLTPQFGHFQDNQSPDITGTIPLEGFDSLDSAIINGEAGGDWFLIDYSDTRIDANEADGLNKTPAIIGAFGTCDVWQLTGIPAPDLIKPIPPAIKWFPGPVSATLKEKVAKTFAAMWTATDQAWNDEMASCSHTVASVFKDFGYGLTRIGTAPDTYSYPTTAFNAPLPNFTITPLSAINFGGTFLAGLDPDFWNGQGVIFVFTPGTTYLLNVSQLDQSKWDTSDPSHPKLRPGAVPNP